MGEKRVWEDELFPTKDKFKLAICEPTYGDAFVTIGFASREEAMRWVGRKARVTLEMLDDDHLEMDKLERQ